jgi:hypothetical protein
MREADSKFAERAKFTLFDRIYWQTFEHEHFALTNKGREAWRGEIAALLRFVTGQDSFPVKASEVWQSFWNDFFNDKWHKRDAISVEQILTQGIRLCDASKETGNPVEFFW